MKHRLFINSRGKAHKKPILIYKPRSKGLTTLFTLLEEWAAKQQLIATSRSCDICSAMKHMLIIDANGKAKKKGMLYDLRKFLNKPLTPTRYFMDTETWEDIIKWTKE